MTLVKLCMVVWLSVCSLSVVSASSLGSQVRNFLRHDEALLVKKKPEAGNADVYQVAHDKSCQTSGPYAFINTEDLDQCTRPNWKKDSETNYDCRRWKTGTVEDCKRICSDAGDQCTGFNYVRSYAKHSDGFNFKMGSTVPAESGTCYFRAPSSEITISGSMGDTPVRDCYVKEPNKNDCDRAVIYVHCDNFMTVQVHDTGNGNPSGELDQTTLQKEVKTTGNLDGWMNGRKVELKVSAGTRVILMCKGDGRTIESLIAQTYYNGEQIPTKEETVGNADEGKFYTVISHHNNQGIEVGMPPSTNDLIFRDWLDATLPWKTKMSNNVKAQGNYFSPDARWTWTKARNLDTTMVFSLDLCDEYKQCTGNKKIKCSIPSGRPGWGWGDENHDHSGPPGLTGQKPGNGNDGSGAPGQG